MMAAGDQAAAVCTELERLGIAFERFAHEAVFTVEQAQAAWSGIDATHCKNLFLRNKKGDRHYLVVAEQSRPIDMAVLAALVGESRLSFASPERLLAHLGLTPGAVSPFGLMNDREKAVRVVVDRGLQASVRLGFHPNVNTATVVISCPDFERFLASAGHVVVRF
jgi:Ala-tRNA(Pro) deacylase